MDNRFGSPYINLHMGDLEIVVNEHLPMDNTVTFFKYGGDVYRISDLNNSLCTLVKDFPYPHVITTYTDVEPIKLTDLYVYKRSDVYLQSICTLPHRSLCESGYFRVELGGVYNTVWHTHVFNGIEFSRRIGWANRQGVTLMFAQPNGVEGMRRFRTGEKNPTKQIMMIKEHVKLQGWGF